MNAVELIHELEARGARLETPGPGRLRLIPSERVPPEIISELRARKAELLSLLAELGGEPPTWRKAKGPEPCARCRELEARGVRVLACSCEVRPSSVQPKSNGRGGA